MARRILARRPAALERRAGALPWALLAGLALLALLAAWLVALYLADPPPPEVAPRAGSVSESATADARAATDLVEDSSPAAPRPAPAGDDATPPTGPSAGPATLTLTGRAVGPDGEPLARAILRAGLESLDDELDARVETDGDGRFTWQVPSDAAAGDAARLATSQRGVELAARLALPASARGELEVGDLPFEPPPVLVAGRLVDSAGRSPGPSSRCSSIGRISSPW